MCEIGSSHASTRTSVFHRSAGIAAIALFQIFSCCSATANVGPPSSASRKALRALHTSEEIRVDGILSETSWQTAAVADSFVQIEPEDKRTSRFHTQVRVLFDETLLYIGAFCMENDSASVIRVQDLRRDFDPANNDLFGVVLDPFLDRRHCVSFQVNRLGAQRDLQIFDGQVQDESYDVVWTARVSECAKGWTAEIAIPWRSLRYPSEAESFGINFIRVVRNVNELSAWSPFPRSLTAFRMDFAGVLYGVNPPPPGVHVRCIPYVLYNRNPLPPARTTDLGGDLRWALTTTTSLDLSVNSDFAQADVDQQIINLNRYSIFLPERRVFFTENASLFRIGTTDWVQPFFSRRIGLDETGHPVSIRAGLRVIHQGKDEHAGLLVAKTGGTSGSTFAVGRYNHQFTEAASAGMLVTGRSDEELPRTWNAVGALDGFVRFTQDLSWQGMISASGSRDGDGGLSLNSSVQSRTDAAYFYWNTILVTSKYEPGVGYVAWDDLLASEVGVDLFLRPSWKPAQVRDFEPAMYLHTYLNASDRRLKEIQLTVWPVYVLFNSGAVLSARLVPTWTRLTKPFTPAYPFEISPGNYSFIRYEARFASDASAPVGGGILVSTGRYYRGVLQTLAPSLVLRPTHHASITSSWEWSWLHDIDGSSRHGLLSLLNTEVRLALNPYVQATLFHRRDGGAGLSATSLRISLEYRPLSYLYVLFSDYAGSGEFNGGAQIIVKLNYVYQI
jgi:hypothetical protein